MYAYIFPQSCTFGDARLLVDNLTRLSIFVLFFSLQGDSLASCDAYGVVNLWDVRTISVLASTDLGPQPVNRVAFDPGSSVIAAASNGGDIKMYEIASGNVTSLTGHDDAVQTVLCDLNAEYLVSGSSDTTINIWS